MNRKTCLIESWDKVIRFNEKYFPGWRNTHEIYYSNAIAGEAGEICNAIKHRCGGGTNKKAVSNVELMEEIADLFIYIELLVESKYLDASSLSQAIDSKIEKNIKRMENKL